MKTYLLAQQVNLTKSILLDSINGLSVKELSQKYNMDIDKVNALIKSIEKKSKDSEENIKISSGEKYIEKLVLNISNDCNLACKYCYANGGCYESEKGYMTKEIAKISLDRFLNFYDNVKGIQLFGGEPLLNMEVVKFICEYVDEKFEKGEISKKPAIGAVTNGVLIDDEFISLMKKHNVSLTVSLDGNSDVNNSMRMFKDGTGASEVVEKNIRLLKEELNEPASIQATYNINHINQSISVMDVVRYIIDNFGTMAHVVPAAGKDEDFLLDNYDEFLKSVDEIFASFEEENYYDYPLVKKIIDTLKMRIKGIDHMCPAGLGYYAVSIDGSVYPCFTFTDNEEMLMGNVMDENLFSSENFIKIKNQFANRNKNIVDPCNKCFARKVCSGCVGQYYKETGSIDVLSKSICDLQKRMIEKVILHIIKLQEKQKDREKLAQGR
ncbi:radical SAM/SPASM domain-containing protein [Clostridium cellulovorans]|uniref:Radical SAM domain protein n=1 Tax=Clostridium cellulovorans (strain ATCC 35296 / DSM 3052 / OCM 3 / 743B) TaxID=573061 RepID=D9SMX1_CLOC7|nr:radical SAM/SPASM domain-containing protein [Clostridium cellulovorans]ADL51837.1 Radical SAM domain protein [Clostridium cellulovorans 743B]